MNCLKPFTRREDGLGGFSCKQCMPCRIDTSREKKNRIILESRLHEDNCFVTLTYAPEHLPFHYGPADNPSGATLVERDVQLFLKRVRKLYPPKTVRYFYCGEYGDESQRPHYHLVLFGVSPLDEGILREKWTYGFVQVDELNPERAGYVAQYVVKKWTRKNDPYLEGLLAGRDREFARGSLRPGLAAGAADIIAESIENRDTDIPKALRVDGQMRPLGRYLKTRIAEKVANKEDVSEYERKIWLQKVQEEKKVFEAEAQKLGISLKEYLGQMRVQRYRNKLARHKVYRQKRTL